MTKLRNLRQLRSRANVLALFLGIPTILAAVGLGALETWRVVRPNSPLFVAPLASSLADAIARDDVYRAYELIRTGHRPNDPIAVRHPVLTGGRTVQVAPLLWAVATQRERAVAMLLGFGARLDAVTKHDAVCMAEQLGRGDIVHLLELDGPDTSREGCPGRGAGEAVLLATRD